MIFPNTALEQIAQDSAANEQATGQVNLAIDQVAQVVQENSATSEENAAGSEELSSQAQSLQALIAQFKLKGNTSAGPLALPQVKHNQGAEEVDSSLGDIIF